jgi:hypothetical protein
MRLHEAPQYAIGMAAELPRMQVSNNRNDVSELSTESKNIVEQLYVQDFQMFGYPTR